jgi:hypothetical protein
MAVFNGPNCVVISPRLGVEQAAHIDLCARACTAPHVVEKSAGD